MLRRARRQEGAAARKATFTPADAASAASSKEAEQPPPVPPPASAQLIRKFGAPLCEVAFLFNTRQPYQLTARSKVSCLALLRDDFNSLMSEFKEDLARVRETVMTEVHRQDLTAAMHLEAVQRQRKRTAVTDLLYAASAGEAHQCRQILEGGESGVLLDEVRLQGACVGCSKSSITLNQGIKRMVPGRRGPVSNFRCGSRTDPQTHPRLHPARPRCNAPTHPITIPVPIAPMPQITYQQMQQQQMQQQQMQQHAQSQEQMGLSQFQHLQNLQQLQALHKIQQQQALQVLEDAARRRSSKSRGILLILDSTWEGEFCRVAEAHPKVHAYVKNHNMGFEVPYRYGSIMRRYIPDFIVLVDDGHGPDDLLHLVVEIKGYRGEDAKDKKSTMETYWVPGVNNLGRFGRWAFAEFTDVFTIEEEFNEKVEGEFDKMIETALALSAPGNA